jgi:ABC-2 family transporter
MIQGERVRAAAVACGRDLSRRGVALTLLTALPLAFYGASAGEAEHGVEVGGIAMAFSVAGAAIFAAMTARAVDQRLTLAGYSPLELLLGRLLVLVLLGFVVAAIFATVIAATSGISDFSALLGALVLVVVIGVPFGLAVGALAPRELEAVLVMVGVVGVQLSLIGTELVAKLLPFWGPHRLLNLATGDRIAALESALAGVGYGLGLLLAAALLLAQRIRIEAPVQGGAAHIPPRASRTATFSTEEGN